MEGIKRSADKNVRREKSLKKSPTRKISVTRD